MVNQGRMEARTTLHHLWLNSYFNTSLYYRGLLIKNRSSKTKRKKILHSLRRLFIACMLTVCCYFPVKLKGDATSIDSFEDKAERLHLCLGNTTAFIHLFLECSNQSSTSWYNYEPSFKTHTTSNTIFLHSALEAGWKKNAFSWAARCVWSCPASILFTK